MSSTLLSSAQCAEKLGLSLETVVRLAKSGQLPASYLARRWKFREEDVDGFVQSRRRSR